MGCPQIENAIQPVDGGSGRIPPRIGKPFRGSSWGSWVSVSVLGAMAILFWFDPTKHGFYPVCMLYQSTGILCPGCGALRAGHQLLHGNIIAALHYNVLLVAVFPFVAIYGVWMLYCKARGLRMGKWKPVWIWLGLTILVLFGILRNLPFAKAAWLAP
jgi:hypothetical protein